MSLLSSSGSALSVADEHSPFATGEPALRSETSVGERVMLAGLIMAGQRDSNWLTDQLFYARHPDLRGKKLRPDQRDLIDEWSAIQHDLVQPALAGLQSAAPVSSPAKKPGVRKPETKKEYALRLADNTSIKRLPGVTIRQLIEQWRPEICAEVPIEILLGFLAFEPGEKLFEDATHGSPRNHWTSPPFYELGLFQTPAGRYGACPDGVHCTYDPPGIELPHDRSEWSKLCEKIGAKPDDWTNPTTQVRVGLANLAGGAASVRHRFPDLFPTKGSDWDLRMAVLYSFARGPGAAAAFLSHFHKDLSTIPESMRWDFLRGKSLPAIVNGLSTKNFSPFDPHNVDEKVDLAKELGYVEKPDASTQSNEAFEVDEWRSDEQEIADADYSAAAETWGSEVESHELDPASNEAASVDPASNEYRTSFGLPELEFDAGAGPMAEFDTETFHRLAELGPDADQVTAAAGIASGKRDTNSLTDFVFYSRHPELKGSRIQPGQTGLISEWQQIRDTVAAPALAKLHDSAANPSPTPPIAGPGTQPAGDPDTVAVYDGRTPAPGTTKTPRSFETNPPITSDSSNRNATRYANVINQFAVGVNPRYKVITNPQTHAVSTFCNIFCWDVTRAMGVELPHWVDATGDPTPPGKGNELNANSVYDWLHHHGSRYGWRQIADQKEAQQLANDGHPVIVAMKAPGGIGHVAVIRPGEFNDREGPAMAQAGSKNLNNTRLYGVFRKGAAVELWAND